MSTDLPQGHWDATAAQGFAILYPHWAGLAAWAIEQEQRAEAAEAALAEAQEAKNLCEEWSMKHQTRALIAEAALTAMTAERDRLAGELRLANIDQLMTEAESNDTQQVPPCMSENDACPLPQPCPSKRRYQKNLTVEWLCENCSQMRSRIIDTP